MAEGFLLGPDLLARTRRTIETVEGGVVGSGFRRIPTVLEGEDGRASPKEAVVLRLPTSGYNSSLSLFPDGVSLSPGCSVDIRISSAPLVNRGTTVLSSQVSSFDEIPGYTRAKRTIAVNQLQFGLSEYFGIVESITSNEETGFTELTLAVSGVITCYVYAFTLDRRLTGAVSIPAANAVFPKSLWRPFATTSPAGSAYVLAFGNFIRLTSAQWPRVYEALVRL
jgi:hypothetical protein